MLAFQTMRRLDITTQKKMNEAGKTQEIIIVETSQGPDSWLVILNHS